MFQEQEPQLPLLKPNKRRSHTLSQDSGLEETHDWSLSGFELPRGRWAPEYTLKGRVASAEACFISTRWRGSWLFHFVMPSFRKTTNCTRVVGCPSPRTDFFESPDS
ncbi:hypothetical protein FALCPG4_012332 [Fusarium falciforme]